MYLSELRKILNNNNLPDEIKRQNKIYFEWNSLSDKLKKLDRIDVIKDYEEILKNSKVLSNNEGLEKMLKIKSSNNDFIKFLESQTFENNELKSLEKIFKSYPCLSCSILQNKFVPEYLISIIERFEESKIKNKVKREFVKHLEVVSENRTRQEEKVNSGKKKFIIERSTLKYFGIRNFQIVNSLSKIGYKYDLLNDDKGSLIITFETGEKNLGILKVVMLQANHMLKLPIRNVGFFSD